MAKVWKVVIEKKRQKRMAINVIGLMKIFHLISLSLSSSLVIYSSPRIVEVLRDSLFSDLFIFIIHLLPFLFFLSIDSSRALSVFKFK